MRFPIKCANCEKDTWGATKYCPYCGVLSVNEKDADDRSAVAEKEKAVLESVVARAAEKQEKVAAEQVAAAEEKAALESAAVAREAEEEEKVTAEQVVTPVSAQKDAHKPVWHKWLWVVLPIVLIVIILKGWHFIWGPPKEPDKRGNETTSTKAGNGTTSKNGKTNKPPDPPKPPAIPPAEPSPEKGKVPENIQKGREAYALNDYRTAESYAQTVLNLDTNNVEAKQLLHDAQAALKRLEEEKKKEQVPPATKPLSDKIAGMLQKGRDALARKEFRVAMTYAENVLELDKNNAEALQLKYDAQAAEEAEMANVVIK